MSQLRVVLDTNILVPSISRKSPLNWVFRSIVNESFTLCVTTDILNEYAELLERFWRSQTSSFVMNTLEYLPSLQKVDVYFRWNLISQDPDDNKFVDCAIACNAKYLATHDQHFEPLKEIDFPKVEVIDADGLKAILGLS